MPTEEQNKFNASTLGIDGHDTAGTALSCAANTVQGLQQEELPAMIVSVSLKATLGSHHSKPTARPALITIINTNR